MKLTRDFVLKAILLGAIAAPTLIVPAFAQQEVDPSWYDPWASKAAAQTVAKAKPANQRKTTVVAVGGLRTKKQAPLPHKAVQVQTALAAK